MVFSTTTLQKRPLPEFLSLYSSHVNYREEEEEEEEEGEEEEVLLVVYCLLLFCLLTTHKNSSAFLFLLGIEGGR